jgi:hypothetical protein
LYGATTTMSGASGRSPASSRNGVPTRRSISAETTSASSGDACRWPECSTGRKRRPLPSSTDRVAHTSAGSSRPCRTTPRCSRRPPCASATSVRGRAPCRVVPSRRRRVGARAPMPPLPAGASLARPAGAGSDHRAGRGSSPRYRRRSCPRARPVRLRPRRACARVGSVELARIAMVCPRSAAAPGRASRRSCLCSRFDSDDEFAACASGLEVSHGVGHVAERVGLLDHRH